MNSEIDSTVTNDYCPAHNKNSPKMLLPKYFKNTVKQSKAVGRV